jgi:hypothetical protein
VGCESIIDGRTPELSGIIDKKFISQLLHQDPIIIGAGAFNGRDPLEMGRPSLDRRGECSICSKKLFRRVESKISVFSFEIKSVMKTVYGSIVLGLVYEGI